MFKVGDRVLLGNKGIYTIKNILPDNGDFLFQFEETLRIARKSDLNPIVRVDASPPQSFFKAVIYNPIETRWEETSYYFDSLENAKRSLGPSVGLLTKEMEIITNK